MWDTTKWVMNWEGVYLDYSNGKVYGLSIHGDRLTAPYKTESLPSAIVDLILVDSLVNLSFISLGLKYIPKEIEALVALESLGFGYNQLSTVPLEINELIKLKILSLNDNQLSGVPDLSGLENLEILSLSANSTLTQLPPSVLGLTTLKRLDIGYTSISELPEGIKDLTVLEELFASAANLTSLPLSIGEMNSLRVLLLANNELTELPPSLGNLANLERLDLSRNRLTGLPTGFSQLTNLRQIRFTNNSLSVFPATISSLPNLRYIYGEGNGMAGQLPPDVFNIPNLRLYLEGNNLSGPLPIKGNNIPERLYIKGNRFTFRDIIAHYNDFDERDNTYIEFQPQQKIGTYRSFEPEGGAGFDLYIDGYSPAPGDVFQWYRASPGTVGVPVAGQDTLRFPAFDPATDGGVYRCVVTNPALPGLSLESNDVRVVGKNAPPSVSVKNVVFRQGSVPVLHVAAVDDYTPGDGLVYDIPSGTANFVLADDRPFPYQRSIYPRDGVWTGTDTVTVSATDEHGLRGSAKATITVLPAGNVPPAVNIPPIYMSNYQDFTPICTPGAPDCPQKYIWESFTYLRNFVRDDFTDPDELEYEILEATDASGTVIPGRVYCVINKWPDGIVLQANVIALGDSTFTLTLKVSDPEGGESGQQVTFIGNGASPNRHPQVGAIPDQMIPKGAKEFPPLDLNAHTTEDYLPDSLLLWRASSPPSLRVMLEEGVATVVPAYPDSSYTATVAYHVEEGTNYLRYGSVSVTYRIVDGVAVNGTVRDGQGAPLPGVSLQGFPREISTDGQGAYGTSVLLGWDGKVYPVLENYRFVPDTVVYGNLLESLEGQDFTGTYVGPYTISGTVRAEMGGPLAQVRLDGLPGSPLTNEAGMYSAEVPNDWEGEVAPVLEGYTFEPAQRAYGNLQGNLASEDYTGLVITGLGQGVAPGAVLVAYPSPSSGEVHFAVDGHVRGSGHLTIYNALGQECGRVPLIPGVLDYSWSVQSRKAVSGVYYGQLVAEGQIVETVKFIIGE